MAIIVWLFEDKCAYIDVENQIRINFSIYDGNVYALTSFWFEAQIVQANKVIQTVSNHDEADRIARRICEFVQKVNAMRPDEREAFLKQHHQPLSGLGL